LQNINIPPIDVIINKIKYTAPEGDNSSLEIMKSSELQTLHQTIINYIKQYLQKDASLEMLYKGNETGITENTKLWLDTFNDKTANNNYWPHITLNCHNAETTLPLKFKANTIALCHVGDGVTCRKILFEKNLTSN